MSPMDTPKFLTLGEQERTDWIADLFEKEGDSSVCKLVESIAGRCKADRTQLQRDCLVLASQSPRRKYFIEEVLGVKTVTKKSPTRELLAQKGLPLSTLTKTIAVMKVLPLIRGCALEGRAVLGSDTLIMLENGDLVGKAPGDTLEERLLHAQDILTGLLGKSQTVSTSMVVYDSIQNKLHIVQDSVEIEFFAQTPEIVELLRGYISLSRKWTLGRGPEGKAGCYGLQEPEIVSITRRISGDPFVAIGLPLSQTKALLESCGVKTLSYSEEAVYEAIWGSQVWARTPYQVVGVPPQNHDFVPDVRFKMGVPRAIAK